MPVLTLQPSQPVDLSKRTPVDLSKRLHHHITSSSSDCDGTYTNDWTQVAPYEPYSSEARGEGGRGQLVFVDMNEVRFTGSTGIARHGLPLSEVYNEHREGYRHIYVHPCTDRRCEPETTGRRRDHRAEAAGF